MNTAALKAFAPVVRRQLLEAVSGKLDYVLTAQTPDYLTTYAPQVAALRRLAQADRTGLIERVAYTWFNRLTALRYLDARGWHPFRSRVLMAASSEETQPEVLKQMRNGALPSELAQHTNPTRLNDLLDGRVPSPDPQGEVYRHLVLAACRFYHALLPDVFEKLDDETELLLPDDLLTEHSVVRGFRTEISDADCAEVELVGWLYQFYISERKDQVMARKASVPAEDIPAVTQIFTPHWIVRYLVENSLGRLWLLNRPASQLRKQMPYYIEAEHETDFPKITKPEEIRVLDPAVGSGHMLTYAFDLLHAIYEEEGYPPGEIPGLILQHNLCGIDTDCRAAQLAELALVFKAREKSRRFFQPEHLVRPNVIELRDLRFAEGELQDYVDALGLGSLFTVPVLRLLNQFNEAKNFGSLIQPCLENETIGSIHRAVQSKDLGTQLFLRETHLRVLRLFEQAGALAQRYHVVVANPPYMGSGAMNSTLLAFVRDQFPDASADLYSAFIKRNLLLTLQLGTVAMITIPNWMFLASFDDLRTFILDRTQIASLVHNGRGVWGSDFGSCSFVIVNDGEQSARGIFRKLFHKQGQVQSNEELEANFFNQETYPVYRRTAQDFRVIPGAPFGFWLTDQEYQGFKVGVPLGTVGTPAVGLQTGSNDRFIRYWHEIEASGLKLGANDSLDARASGRKWFPYTKGGPFRKWYGNNIFVVNWKNDGEEICSHPGAYPRNRSQYFKPAITYTNVSSAAFAARFTDCGFIFDQKGSMILCEREEELLFILALLHTNLVTRYLSVLCATVDFNPGSLAKVPIVGLSQHGLEVAERSRKMVRIARTDWDNGEGSWNFRELPLLRPGLKSATLEATWKLWKEQCDDVIRELQTLETENNRLFIETYGLKDELEPEVREQDITLARADMRRDMAAFLSYAVGCMMGRYSLDKPGLVLANVGDSGREFLEKVGLPRNKLAFTPDEDGIIPVLDGEWFENDIVARIRDFLRAIFGETTLRENIRFAEESLGRDLRKYFLTDFYKDHLQTYKKRPIYWMVQSPRKGFSVLIYLHRYTRDTMNLVLNKYLREYEVKLRHRLNHVTNVQASDSISARDKTAARKEADKLLKTLHDCEEWERQTILPLAQARIELDLDDGVKVNYLKLGEALAPIAGIAAEDE